MTKKTVGITIDPDLMASHYRAKVTSLGMEKAVQVTMEQCGITKDDATALLDGRKKIEYKNSEYSLVDVTAKTVSGAL